MGINTIKNTFLMFSVSVLLVPLNVTHAAAVEQGVDLSDVSDGTPIK